MTLLKEPKYSHQYRASNIFQQTSEKDSFHQIEVLTKIKNKISSNKCISQVIYNKLNTLKMKNVHTL